MVVYDGIFFRQWKKVWMAKSRGYLEVALEAR